MSNAMHTTKGGGAMSGDWSIGRQWRTLVFPIYLILLIGELRVERPASVIPFCERLIDIMRWISLRSSRSATSGSSFTALHLLEGCAWSILFSLWCTITKKWTKRKWCAKVGKLMSRARSCFDRWRTSFLLWQSNTRMVPFVWAYSPKFCCVELEAELIAKDPSCRGAYLLVNSPTERFLCETHDSAWRAKAPHGFVGKIGIEDSSEEVLL